MTAPTVPLLLLLGGCYFFDGSSEDPADTGGPDPEDTGSKDDTGTPTVHAGFKGPHAPGSGVEPGYPANIEGTWYHRQNQRGSGDVLCEALWNVSGSRHVEPDEISDFAIQATFTLVEEESWGEGCESGYLPVEGNLQALDDVEAVGVWLDCHTTDTDTYPCLRGWTPENGWAWLTRVVDAGDGQYYGEGSFTDEHDIGYRVDVHLHLW